MQKKVKEKRDRSFSGDKMRKKNGSGYAGRHGSIIEDRVDSSKVSQDTCKIKYMYENMQKQREDSHRKQ